jgi:hypothetical protein
MTDPVAEAAAKIAADMTASSTEPSLLEKAMDTIHDLEAKVEHLIHPETEAPPVEAPKEALLSGTAADSAPNAGTGISVEPGNVAGAAVAGAPEAGGVAAGGGEEAGTTVTGEAGSVAGAPVPSVSATESLVSPAPTSNTANAGDSPNALGSASTTEVVIEPSPAIANGITDSAETDLPNAVPAAVEQPGTPPSAPDASTPDGIPGIVVSSPAEPAKLASAAASAIKAGIANIRHHLSIRGFEQSAVADIHAELEAIEKWL